VFYDALLNVFGFRRVVTAGFGELEPVWRRVNWKANDEFFGFVVDPEFRPNQNRVAFHAPTRKHVDRATAALRGVDAPNLDGPVDYRGYYATFFDDPDGNRLEVCFLTSHGGLEGPIRAERGDAT